MQFFSGVTLFITTSFKYIFYLRALSVVRCCVLNRFFRLYIQAQTIIQLNETNEIMIIIAAVHGSNYNVHT